MPRNLGPSVAYNTAGCDPMSSRIFQPANDKRSPAARGNANQNVSLANLVFVKIFPGLLYVVLRFLHCFADGCVAAGDQAYDSAVRHPVSRRNFRSIEHAKTTAGTS